MISSTNDVSNHDNNGGFKVDEAQIGEVDFRINERFHLYPFERLQALSITSGVIGGFSGVYDGIKSSSLKYLTENGHRLPKTVGGWYFYHKKKNYVMILAGARNGVRQGLKYSVAVGGFFGLEWLIDTYVRGNTIDFLNTTAAATLFSGFYSAYNRLSRVQSIGYIKKGGALGLSLGITQDLLIFSRGGNVWYLEKLGIRIPREEQVLQ